MLFRCIAPKWLIEEQPQTRSAIEGSFSEDKIKQLNTDQFYNIYFFPNYPFEYNPNETVKGSMIDTFKFVFVDMDLKEKKYQSKEEFLGVLKDLKVSATYIVDSGNGIHAYWQVEDLDPISYLRLQRRLMRFLNTDPAVGTLNQLMRVPGTFNTKIKGVLKPCEIIEETPSAIYSCEDLDKALPNISLEDEEYCQQHYNKAYGLQEDISVDDKIPVKFMHLLRSSKEAKDIWSGSLEDRSKGDYRLAHIMLASDFTRDEAMSVLVNAPKALERAPTHRIGYARGIVDKVWTYEENNTELNLSNTVKEILNKYGSEIKGTRFPCYKYIDDTEGGFRLGQVIGLVAGSGVGKTVVALDMFEGFVQFNPDYDHFFIPLEQPSNEIADRWAQRCKGNETLYNKVHIMSNYADDGTFRHLSLSEIKEYILKVQQVTKKKIGCVVIDHIGALKKKGADDEKQGLMDICHEMKAFAVQTNTLLIMQSQAPREKAGIGDLELNKDAAYGTVYFESYCDYLITIWQPLKRCYTEDGCPYITAFKFCKIRHKSQSKDQIKEDVCYTMIFDSESGRLREVMQSEEAAIDYFNLQATNKRKLDRKTDLVKYNSRVTDATIKNS